MLIRVLTVCHHHSTTTSLHTIALWVTRGTADRYGPKSSMHFFGFSISNLLQNLLPTTLRHLFSTLPYTPFTLYKQINPHKQQHSLHACWQAHTLVLHSHILVPNHTCMHPPSPKLARRGAALLQLPERAEQLVGLLWWVGPDAAGLTPCRHSSWNTPGLSVLTFFNLICIRPSLGPNRFGGRKAWQGGCGPIKKQTNNNSIRLANHPCRFKQLHLRC